MLDTDSMVSNGLVLHGRLSIVGVEDSCKILGCDCLLLNDDIMAYWGCYYAAESQRHSSVLQFLLVSAWYAGNTMYNIYNKKAANMLHAHWFLAAAQLVVGIVWSLVMWGSGFRKAPNLTAKDIASCVPIGLCAALAHAGSVLASAVGAVSFAQIVKACEPVFAAVVGILLPPADIKPMLAYAMLLPIVGGVGLACIKEGKGVDINYTAFAYASMANVAAALKGKLGGSVTKALKSDKAKNMDAANVSFRVHSFGIFLSATHERFV